ncbi:hypothetical protein BD324DRAFT_198995 [Kockovaella imperatae]|uniref:Arrestin-like N-terminal domain-containing protein n=1 Tax=Kockovaella imperatae TaxID=4999 RepID=A0A1Y1U6X5_9TREE|nr:hypothetical protein BD324DRAFT_198995 [Kockovaella imperatae]ORX33781.1 hypothetical protein BD324DRAFT_198995 [Kockovaella imperatae]
MSIGRLDAKVKLDYPSRVHYGPDDKVTGCVHLTYYPEAKTISDSNHELFAKLALDVTFHGRAKSKIWVNRGQQRSIHRGRVQLFTITKRIYHDVFKIQSGESLPIPFELSFPERAQLIGYQEEWRSNFRFLGLESNLILPPSMHIERSLFGNSASAFVEYRIGCSAQVERLKVVVTTPSRALEPIVNYDRPRRPMIHSEPWTLRGMVTVSNKELMKAAFHSDYYPTYTFDYTVDCPREIYNHCPITLIVKIMPKETTIRRSDLVEPLVTFGECSMEFQSVASIRASAGLLSEHEYERDDQAVTLRGRQEPMGPFNASEGNTKVITFDPVFVPSSFKFVNITLGYRIKVKYEFTVAGKVSTFGKEYQVSVRPPPPGTNQSSAQTEVAPSYRDAMASRNSSSSSLAGPSSKEILASTQVNPSLPRDPPPPTYDE